MCPDKNSCDLRLTRGLKRRRPITPEPTSKKKRLRSFDHITSLPDELLLHIFSYLNINDLYFNVRLVCTKWRQIAMLSSAWINVTAGNDIPSHILRNWIQTSPLIKRFEMSGRNDADVIMDNISKYLPNLESITIVNCWGSTKRICLGSGALNKLLTRCKKLGKINFDKVKIRSCKFFELLAKRKGNGKFLQLSYVGPVTPKQYNTLKESCSGWICTEFIEIDDSSD